MQKMRKKIVDKIFRFLKVLSTNRWKNKISQIAETGTDFSEFFIFKYLISTFFVKIIDKKLLYYATLRNCVLHYLLF